MNQLYQKHVHMSGTVHSNLMSSTAVNIAKVKEMATENHHLSLREIAAELSVPHESIRIILNDFLGMKRVAAWLVPKDHLTGYHCERNSGQKLNEYHRTTTVFTWYGSGRLSFSKTQITTSRHPFSVDRRHIRWHKCTISRGAYFEGDKINLNE